MQTSKPTTVQWQNLVDLLRWRADHQPNQRAYTFLADGETETGHLTYAELDRQARAIAVTLQQMNAAGERVLLLYPAGLEFIPAFFGCLYAGAIAVPTHPPRPKQRALARIEPIAVDAQAKIALTTSESLIRIKPHLKQLPGFQSLHWLESDQIIANTTPDAWHAATVSGDALAFLQYTSGSTNAPKGVMISHNNLLHNLEAIRQIFQIDPSQHHIGLHWLPMHHDMGLIGGVIEPLYAGILGILMPPTAFIERPLRWLEAISRYKVAISGGPNFAYDVCVDKLSQAQAPTLDLSNWQVAYCGAEPVRAETLDRFAAAYAPYGFRPEAFHPCYGLAESTLMATGGDKFNLPVIDTIDKASLQKNKVIKVRPEETEAGSIVGCGCAIPGQKLIAVDPNSLTPCPPDRVGEIWISGPSVAQGYWGRSEETTQMFQACLADTGEGPFLRTGDLGFLQEGQLFVTGRLKDILIIRGQNYYPQDIEQVAETSHPALPANGGAAFSVEVESQEQLVIVFELTRQHRKANVEEAAAAVRQAVAQVFELETYAVLLIKPGRLPRTTSGKVQRYLCRAQFLEETLPVIGSSLRHPLNGRSDQGASIGNTTGNTTSMPHQDFHHQLETAIRTQLAELLNISPAQIDLQQSIQSLGLGSLQAAALKYQLEDEFGLDIPPALFFEEYSLEQFIAELLLNKAITIPQLS